MVSHSHSHFLAGQLAFLALPHGSGGVGRTVRPASRRRWWDAGYPVRERMPAMMSGLAANTTAGLAQTAAYTLPVHQHATLQP